MSEDRYWIGIGDIHGDPANIQRIPGVSESQGILIHGDITTGGDVDAVQAVVEVVQSAHPNVWAQIGNMDPGAATDWFDAKGLGLHARAMEIAPSVGMIGVGYSSPTPFGTPSEVPDATLGQWLDQTYAKVGQWEQLLLVSHDSPYGTSLDMVHGTHVGSKMLREFIEKVQPTVCLCGHIHEGRGVDHLGATTVVNPGMLSMGGYALIELSAGRLRAELKLVEG